MTIRLSLSSERVPQREMSRGISLHSCFCTRGNLWHREGRAGYSKPVAVVTPYYLPLIALAAILVAVCRERLEPLTRHRSVDSIDALGMGAFAVIGMQKAPDAP